MLPGLEGRELEEEDFEDEEEDEDDVDEDDVVDDDSGSDTDQHTDTVSHECCLCDVFYLQIKIRINTDKKGKGVRFIAGI